MNEQTAWEKAASADGTTPSERALANLARKAFLSLWSYANVFTDEGRANGKGDGKELCDLLVVFGNDVLLFSDKDCTFRSDIDVTVAWPRWYRSAIDKSAKQLAGAEKFLKSYPKRVFLDKGCQAPLPIELPDSRVARYYLIAVTRGSHFAARQFFGGGSSGSVMLLTHLVGKADHEKTPFHVGFPLESRRFVHVLDEMTVDVLLDELDTVPDLVNYLRKKEEFLQRPDAIFSVPGEEELLARYMSTMRDDEHAFPRVPADVNFVALPEGDWDLYRNSPQWKAKQEANEISYMWDALIEHQSGFIRSGKAITVPWQPSKDGVNHERIIRPCRPTTPRSAQLGCRPPRRDAAKRPRTHVCPHQDDGSASITSVRVSHHSKNARRGLRDYLPAQADARIDGVLPCGQGWHADAEGGHRGRQ